MTIPLLYSFFKIYICLFLLPYCYPFLKNTIFIPSNFIGSLNGNMTILNIFNTWSKLLLPFTMNEFKTILTKLKEIISQQLQTDKKMLDKDVAETLGIKPATFASYKSRSKPPYQDILTSCHEKRLDMCVRCCLMKLNRLSHILHPLLMVRFVWDTFGI